MVKETAATGTTVTVINHSRDGITVHRPGCSDIARATKLRHVNSDWPVTIPAGANIAEAVAASLNADFGWPYEGSDEPAPWSASNIKVLPCTKR